MVDVVVVEVDGFLYQPEAQGPGVEIDVRLSVIHSGSDVVESEYARWHGVFPQAPTGNLVYQRTLRFLRARFQRGEYLGLHLTVGFLISLTGLFLFILIARQVVGQHSLTELDLAVYQWLHRNATVVGYSTWSVISSLGGGVAFLWIGLGMGILLVMRKHFLLLAGWVTALLGGGSLDYLLKHAFQRPRPENAADFLSSMSWSFPSGHTMGSVIGYGMLAYLIWVEFGRTREARQWTIALCGFMIIAVGLSRLYLGVHYLSDVLAGLCAGGLWLTACITGLEVARRLRKRAPVAPET
jgi:undecaprenyl-diphosphatase